MTKGKRTNFKDEEELKGLLDGAWNRIAARSSAETESGKKKRTRSCPFSVASVAEEAGCARSLVGHETCPYPELRIWLTEKIKTEAQLVAGAPSTVLLLREEVASLEGRLKARYRAYNSLCKKLGVDWARRSAHDDDVQKNDVISVREQIRYLREIVKDLKKRIALFDTQYANLILRQRLTELGLKSDMRPVKPASKARRRSSISIVGKAEKAE